MALFGIKMKKRHAAVHGSYHIDDYQDKSFFRRAKTKEPIGIMRALFSGLSLSFGASMCYVAMHYIPAFIQPHKILSATTIDMTAHRLEDKGPIRKIFGPYIDAFSIQRTYLRGGQEIQAQFILPEGAALNLNISQCRRVFALEILKCDIIMQNNVKITNKTIGAKSFQFPDKGFYHFSHEITFKDNVQADYKIVWTRF